MRRRKFTNRAASPAFHGMLAVALLMAFQPPAAGDDEVRKQDEQSIRAAAAAYRAALAKGNRNELGDFWTADGDYVDGAGVSHPASELLAEAEQAARQGPGPENKITASKIRFVAPDVAIEDGTSESSAASGDSAGHVSGHYHATWVKQQGRWRLANLCELPDNAGGIADLDELAWMIGTWTAEHDGSYLEVRSQWNATGTFLLRDMKVIRDGAVVQRGSQRFGRDPASGKIRSWSFDADGGFGEATWTKQGDRWLGQATGTLADGRATSATSILSYDGKDSYTRKTIAGRIEDAATPDQVVRFKRQNDAQR